MDFFTKHEQQLKEFIKAANPTSAEEEMRLKVEFTKSEIDKKKQAIHELQDELAHLEGSLSAYIDNLSSLS